MHAQEIDLMPGLYSFRSMNSFKYRLFILGITQDIRGLESYRIG